VSNLDKDALVRILMEPKNAVVKQYQRMFELDNVELELTEDALEAVSEQALLRGTGARGLRAILEEVLLEVMYDLPPAQPHRHRQVRHRPIGRARPREPHAGPPGRGREARPPASSSELATSLSFWHQKRQGFLVVSGARTHGVG
jgi:hypothetical protein